MAWSSDGSGEECMMNLLKKEQLLLKLCIVSKFEQEISLQELVSPVVLFLGYKQRNS